MKNIEMLKNLTVQSKMNPALALWASIKDLAFAVAVLGVAVARLIISIARCLGVVLVGTGKGVVIIVLGLVDLVETIVLYIPDVIRWTRWAAVDAWPTIKKLLDRLGFLLKVMIWVPLFLAGTFLRTVSRAAVLLIRAALFLLISGASFGIRILKPELTKIGCQARAGWDLKKELDREWHEATA